MCKTSVDAYLLGAHEEQMLHCVSHAWKIGGIAETSNVDIHGCARFIRVWIVDEEHFQLVRQHDDSI